MYKTALHLIIAVLTVIAALPSTARTAPTMPTKIAILSDTHLLAPELFNPDNTAFRAMANNEMRLVEHSDYIIKAMVDTIIAAKTQLVFITGDLTHNGERASHLRLVEHLRRLQNAGITVLVIPGNHDISNPYARAYLADNPEYVPTITRPEFAQIYASMGYDLPSTRRDPASLSYACEPVDGLVVIGLDSNRDEENQLIARGDSIDRYNSAGRLRPETLDWACRQAREARKAGKRVITLMHHHLNEHFDGEAHYLPKYILDNNSRATQALTDAGVRVIFTGHLHITDAAADPNGKIIDLATGTATSFPFAIRFADYDGTSLNVTTSFLALPELQQQGRRQVEQGVPVVLNMFVSRIWSRVAPRRAAILDMLAEEGVDTTQVPVNAKEATALAMKHMRRPLTESLLAMSRGGENPRQGQAIIEIVRAGVIEMITDVLPTQAEYMTSFVDENLMPRVAPLMRSTLEDRNYVGTPHESQTHDHTLRIVLE